MQRKNARTGSRVKVAGKQRKRRVTSDTDKPTKKPNTRRVGRRGHASSDATESATEAAIVGTLPDSDPPVSREPEAMNNPEIDDQLIAQQMQAAASQAVPGLDDLEPVAADAEALQEASPVVESWAPAIKQGLVPVLRAIVLPQWELSDGECDAWDDALAGCLDQFVPGGLSGKYACVAQLVMVSAGIAGMRMTMNDGKLPPMGPKRRKPVEATSDAETEKA